MKSGVWICFSALLLWSGCSMAIPDGEREALLAIFNALDGPNWEISDAHQDYQRWGGEAGTECDWPGVTCQWIQEGEDGYYSVKELEFNRLYFSGTLPDEIGDFPNLKQLKIKNSNIVGPLPEGIGNLSSLQWLDIQVDVFDVTKSFGGPIPESIGNLTSLQVFSAWGQDLTGPLPESIGGLVNLQRLDLACNDFTGSIPESIGNLTKLTKLELSGSGLRGDIPLSMMNMSSLNEVWLQYNALYADDPSLLMFLEERGFGIWEGADLLATQAIDITMLSESVSYLDNNFQLSWEGRGDFPIVLLVSASPGGPFESVGVYEPSTEESLSWISVPNSLFEAGKPYYVKLVEKMQEDVWVMSYRGGAHPVQSDGTRSNVIELTIPSNTQSTDESNSTTPSQSSGGGGGGSVDWWMMLLAGIVLIGFRFSGRSGKPLYCKIVSQGR